MRRGLMLGVALIVVSTLHPAVASAASCSTFEARAGLCVGGGVSRSTVDIGGTQTTPGGSASGGGAGGGGSDADGEGGFAPGASSPSADGSGLGGNPREIVDSLDGCPAAGCAPAGEEPLPAVTLADLASFGAPSPLIRMEPDGWMLRGLPANFIAETTASTASGRLFDRPISVRFEPSAYAWEWGDGETDTVDVPGRTWADLGLRRFSETPTSHTYEERGIVTVSLRVDYAVAYRLGDGPWTTVEGTAASTARVDAYMGTARTVLVPGDCLEDPGAAGC